MDEYILISEKEITDSKQKLLDLGYKISYRNRDGKQYLTVKRKDTGYLDLSYLDVKTLIQKYFPSAIITSYGGTATFRLNP